MPMRKQTANQFFLGTVRRRNTSPFIAQKYSQQPSVVDSISNFIGNTQQSIAIVQQLTPLLDQLKQLSPIISNLPMLMKLMSTMNDVSSDASPPQTSDSEHVDTFVEEASRQMTDMEKKAFIKHEVERILREIGIENN